MKILSLFANIGVGSAYLNDVVLANELETERCNIYRQIYPETEVIQGSIADKDIQADIVARSKSLGVDTIVATPPCQGFSTLNSNLKNKDKQKVEFVDPRNQLIFHFCDVVNQIKPKYILLENVPQIITAKFEGQSVVELLAKELPDYFFEHENRINILDAKWFDTPQSRRRAIFLFSRLDVPKWTLPKVKVDKNTTTVDGKDVKIVTLREAIGHFPSLESGESDIEFHPHHQAHKHSKDHIRWLSHTPTGKSAYDNIDKELQFQPSTVDSKTGELRLIYGYKNTYKRMEWDAPAPTLIAGSHMISSSNTVHPGREKPDGTWSDARTLTLFEAMTVMGLPEDWPLPSHDDDEKKIPYTKLMTYLGEGICPKLVEYLFERMPNA